MATKHHFIGEALTIKLPLTVAHPFGSVILLEVCFAKNLSHSKQKLIVLMGHEFVEQSFFFSMCIFVRFLYDHRVTNVIMPQR